MRLALVLALVLAALGCASCASGPVVDDRNPDPLTTARVLYSTSSTDRIPDLTADSHDFTVSCAKQGPCSVRITGKFKGPYSHYLAADDRAVVLDRFNEDPDGLKSFEIQLPLQDEVTFLKMSAMSPTGEVKSERWVIEFPGWRRLRAQSLPR